MLNENLMEMLNSIQSSLCLETKKKLSYAVANNYGRCFECDGSCEDAPCAAFWRP